MASQGTPTPSPMRNSLACGPSAPTVPTISWPGVTGKGIAGSSPSSTCRSVRRTPQAGTWTSSSCPCGDGRLTSVSTSGAPGLTKRIAFTAAALWCDVARRCPSGGGLRQRRFCGVRMRRRGNHYAAGDDHLHRLIHRHLELDHLAAWHYHQVAGGSIERGGDIDRDVRLAPLVADLRNIVRGQEADAPGSCPGVFHHHDLAEGVGLRQDALGEALDAAVHRAHHRDAVQKLLAPDDRS